MTSQRVPRGMAVADCYSRLRDDIVANRFMPNERLVEADCARRLGVSRAVVRTVLNRLEQDGLVVREPNRGARVRMVGEEEAIEITQVRAVLEALAARQAAKHAEDRDIAELRAILAEMPACLQRGDLLGYSDANARLHARVLAASRHRTVRRLIADLKAQLVRFQYRTILVPGRAHESLEEHTAIVDAIAGGDGDTAEAAMRTHLGAVAATLTRTAMARQQHPEIPYHTDRAWHRPEQDAPGRG